MEKDTVIKRIKALLRKKNGGSQAEVEMALAKAQELAAKYQIDLADCDPEGEDFEVNESLLCASVRLQNEVKLAAVILQDHFNVHCYIRSYPLFQKHEFRAVGTEVDRQVAQFVFDFLVGSFRRSWNTALRTGRFHIRDRHVFMVGMYRGLNDRLQFEKQAQNTERGLMVIGNKLAQRTKYMSRLDLKEGKPMNTNEGSMEAHATGYMEGRKLQLPKGGVTQETVKGELE